MLLQQRQVWHDYTRYLLMNEGASVELYLYNGLSGATIHIYNSSKDMTHVTQLIQKAERLAALAGYKKMQVDWFKNSIGTPSVEYFKSIGYEVAASYSDGCALTKTLLKDD